MFSRILVLCTGNICRSPMGEAMFRRALDPARCAVRSAGTSALVGSQADPQAQRVMREIGVDISAHSAQQASLELLNWADLILVMDREHRDWIDVNHPQLRGRAFRITRWNGDTDINDPYRRPLAAFERARDEIAAGVRGWLGMLS